MGNKKRLSAFEIALSGISCAVAVPSLALGVMTGVNSLTAVGYFLAVIALMLPLSRQFFLGAFLSYLGTLILAIALGAAAQFWKLVPFVMFFGLHPIANALQLRFKINRWLALAVKAVWFDCTLIVGYYLVFGGLLGGSLLPQSVYEVVNKYIFVFIFTLGTVICFVYDYLIFKLQIGINILVHRIIK